MWRSLSKVICIIFHCRTSITHKKICAYIKHLSKGYIKRFTDTSIIDPDCFLIFWFCIKGNQVYYTWITYTPALLASIQLLFSFCMKYVKIQGFSDLYFLLYVGRIIPVFSRIWKESLILSKYRKIQIQFCPYTGK